MLLKDVSNVHIIEHRDLNIVLDVTSGSFHLFDEESLRALKLLIGFNGDKEKTIKELNNEGMAGEEIFAGLEELEKEGMLFTYDDGEIPLTMPTNVKSICLNIAHDCNLACSYCFASQGDFGGKRILMSAEVGKKAIDFLLENSGPRRLCEVDFFGGEPLMNFGVVKELVQYGLKAAEEHKKKIKFSLTTNGVLLNEEVREFLNTYDISTVLSLDGREEVNDRVRFFRGKQGCYNKIVPNYKKFAETRDDYVIRGTYTRHNLDFANDVLSMFNEGFNHLSVEPVVCAEEADFVLREEDLPAIRAEYERLADIYLSLYEKGEEMDFFHFNVDINGGPCLLKRVAACGAGYEYLAVTPEGHIYPCHQFVGQEEFILGNVFEGIKKRDISEHFHGANIYKKEKCRNCWVRFYCSGGCHANAWEFNQNIYAPYELGCEIQKTRLELAIYAQVQKVLINERAAENKKNKKIYRTDEQVCDKIVKMFEELQ